LKQQQFHDIVTGRDKSLKAAVLRFLMLISSRFYLLCVNIRNLLYDWKILRVENAGKPVISIGNITAGGTGKSPTVILLCKYLTDKGLKTAVLTRGYKGTADTADEPEMIAQRCQDSMVVVNKDRVAGAKEAVEKKADVLIADDAFQHRRLGRDMDILCIDATEPFGYEMPLPAGLLREPLAQLKRAHAAVITRGDQVPAYNLTRITSVLQEYNPDICVAESRHRPVEVVYADGSTHDANALKAAGVVIFCGIGNPESFKKTVEACGADIKACEFFDDHHAYSASDLRRIVEKQTQTGADIILTTEKDWVKIARIADNPLPEKMSGYLKIEIEITEGKELLLGKIDEITGSK
jgi:tetraacyldisaccharide 4'-kinase